MGIKVAVISPWNVRCGIFTYTEKLASALAQKDVDVFIVRLPRFGFKSAEILEDVAVRVPWSDIDLVHVQHEYGLYYGAQSLEGAFYNKLREFARVKEQPIVTTMHAVGNWDIDWIVASVSKKVIVHNEFCLKRLKFPNVVVIPHGSSPVESLSREQAKKTLGWGLDANTLTVGYLGFISSYKGLEDLIVAMTKVKNAILLIGGGWHTETDTTYIEGLRERSKKLLPGRVIWLGYVPDEMMSVAYGAMDVFVYPSRYATESGALITALGHGKAVIASSLPPFKEKEKMGALKTYKDIDDLRRLITQLLTFPKARETLEENAKKYAQETSWLRIAEKHIGLYQEILKS